MQANNFRRFCSAVFTFLSGDFDRGYAIAVWLEWVTSGDLVRRQESRFERVSIGCIQFYRENAIHVLYQISQIGGKD